MTSLTWSDVKFEDLLEAALNGRILSNVEDEIVQAIRQEEGPDEDQGQGEEGEEKKEEEKKAKAE